MLGLQGYYVLVRYGSDQALGVMVALSLMRELGPVVAALFLGGWMPLHIAGWDSFNAVMDFLPSPVWFFLKVAVVIFIIMWFKWTFPRLRIDQLLRLEWKYLVPINLLNLLLMVVIVVSGFHF